MSTNLYLLQNVSSRRRVSLVQLTIMMIVLLDSVFAFLPSGTTSSSSSSAVTIPFPHPTTGLSYPKTVVLHHSYRHVVVAAASAISRDSSSSSTASEDESVTSVTDTKNSDTLKRIQGEGGRFAFRTKFGALNPFAIYYGMVAIALGIPWFVALTMYQMFAFVTRGRMDRQRVIPILITHVWGVLLLRFTRMYPRMEGLDQLRDFYKT